MFRRIGAVLAAAGMAFPLKLRDRFGDRGGGP